MTAPFSNELSRRERQLMDALFAIGEGSSAEIRSRLTDDPGYDSVRVTLRNLEKKGYVDVRLEGQRNVYKPAIEHTEATNSALRHLVGTFFSGSSSRAILALLDLPVDGLTKEQLDELAERVERAREEQ
jgi:predicted transcriptional regulator